MYGVGVVCVPVSMCDYNCFFFSILIFFEGKGGGEGSGDTWPNGSGIGAKV